MKTMEINGITFEVHKSCNHPVSPIRGYKHSEIFEAYERPSQYKISIWESWCRWCAELIHNDVEIGIEISSHNCMTFTIAGSIVIDGKIADIWITKCHNRIYFH